jgi:hypothetical protein
MLFELFAFNTLTITPNDLFNAGQQGNELARAFVGVMTQIT